MPVVNKLVRYDDGEMNVILVAYPVAKSSMVAENTGRT